mgnify:CR=1 FL=1
MGFDNSVHAGFFLLILITGVLATISDLRHRKIRNNHLVIIAVAAVILTVAKGLSDRSLPMLQLSSTACAIIIALVFYKNDLWRGGDAKLFVLFSLLMPATGYASRIFLPSIALFVNTFIIALVFLGLLLFKNLFINPRSVTEDILKAMREYRPGRAIALTFYVSWIIFPLFRACGLAQYGVLSFLIIYMINVYLSKQVRMLIYNKAFTVAVFAGGLFLRYKFLPGFFLWKNFLLYLASGIIYPALAFILSCGTERITKSDDRIPFSPFLFLGCLSSYTPFLGWIMSLQHLGK